MNAQEIFNVVSAHLLAQNERAVMPRGGKDVCAYRAPDGKKCAFGVLIPNNLYSPSMETKAVFNVLSEYSDLPQYLRDNESLITHLQIVHDSGDPTRWREVLNLVASQFGLIGLLEEAA